MTFIEQIRNEIQTNKYKGETSAMVANVFFYNASGTTRGGYHIEFTFDNINEAQEFSQVLATYDMLPKLMEQQNRYLVYLKSAQCLCNLLALIGAKKCLMELHNEIALRDVRNNTNRRANCDKANIEKQVSVSLAQIEKIHKMQQSGELELLSQKLRTTAQARIQHPDFSYEELAAFLGITKSGVVNRLRKLLSSTK